MSKKLEEELKERLHAKRLEKDDKLMTGISGGYCYTVDDGQKIFVKTNSSRHAQVMFEGELESLKQIIATRTIRVPRPRFALHHYDDLGGSAIVMEHFPIKPLSESKARDLGASLAKLHDYNAKISRYNKRAAKWIGGKPPSVKHLVSKRDNDNSDNSEGEEEGEEEEEEEETIEFSKHSIRVRGSKDNSSSKRPDNEYAERFVPETGTEEITQFGFNLPTSCGLIPQVNEWTDDWVSFYARHRLDKAIRSILSDHGDRELHQGWSLLQLKVDKFFSDISTREETIIPALLHGDLWSGNVAELSEDSNAVAYDPSSFYGHSEYDFGIARMFGGMPKTFEVAYFEAMPKKKLFETRNKLYQLFHHLNHWDHFGSGYRASSLRLIKDLNALM